MDCQSPPGTQERALRRKFALTRGGRADLWSPTASTPTVSSRSTAHIGERQRAATSRRTGLSGRSDTALVDDIDARPLTLYKRWVIRPGVTAEDVQRFVQQRIEPTCRLLSDDVELGLEFDHDRRSLLAVQRWTSGEHHPSLVERNMLVDFDTEWQTTVVPVSEH